MTLYGELGYLRLVKQLLNRQPRIFHLNRTADPTISTIGAMMRFNLRDMAFPLLTTKRVAFQSVVKELLWFIRGETDQKILSDSGVNIWSANASRKFLDSRKLFQYDEGRALGPIYGFQWRHFNAKYHGVDADYTGKGVDQLQECINLIKRDPTSRRIIMSAWNPQQLHEMVLPPCHVLVQFHVHDGKYLTSHLYQRSGDLMLGVPYNIASYSLLTHMIAQVCNLEAYEFVHTISDVHIYKSHIDGAEEQILRIPRTPPTLKLNPKIKNIDDFDLTHIDLLDYKPYAHVQFQMAL